MNLQLSVSLYGLLPWIFFAVLIAIFIFNRKRIRPFAWSVPALIFAGLLGMEFNLWLPGRSSEAAIYADTGYSMSLASPEKKRELLRLIREKTGLGNAPLKDFSGRSLDALPDDFTPLYHPPPYGAKAVLTDVTSPLSFDDLPRAEISRQLSGIFRAEVPASCLIGRECPLKFLLRTTGGGQLILRESGRELRKSAVNGGFHGWKNFPLTIGNGEKPGNRFLCAVLSAPDALRHDTCFVLSLRKGLPTGGVKTPRTTLLSWRLHHLLHEFPFWKTEPDNGGRYDFRVHLGEGLPGETASVPRLIILVGSNAAPSGWQKKSAAIWTRGRDWLTLWNPPALRGNVFTETADLSEVISEFGRLLKTDGALVNGMQIEAGRTVYFNARPEKPITAGADVLQVSYDPARRQYFTVFPDLRDYDVEGLTVRAGIQSEELLEIYRWLAEPPAKAAEKSTVLNAAEGREESGRFAFSPGQNSGTAASAVFLLLLCTLLLWLWYGNSLKT